MIKYIIHKVQDDIVLYCNTVYSELYASVGILLTCGKHFHDRTISLIKEVWTNKTSITPLPLIEVHVQTRKVSSLIFVCQGYCFSQFLRFFDWNVELLRQCDIVFSFKIPYLIGEPSDCLGVKWISDCITMYSALYVNPMLYYLYWLFIIPLVANFSHVY